MHVSAKNFKILFFFLMCFAFASCPHYKPHHNPPAVEGHLVDPSSLACASPGIREQPASHWATSLSKYHDAICSGAVWMFVIGIGKIHIFMGSGCLSIKIS